MCVGAMQADWKRVEPDLELVFPRDHGVHEAYRTEWWYLTGHLSDPTGRRFGFQFTVFRNGLDPTAPRPGASALRARHVFAAHFVLTDVSAGRTRFAERLRRGGTPLARASVEDLDVVVEDWSLERIEDDGDDRVVLRASDSAQGLKLELELRPEKPLVLQGRRGYSRKGQDPGNASAYVSWTRLAVTGELGFDGAARSVSGEAWFDHEFGSSVLAEGVVGWDWFGLQLLDGRELMLFHLRDRDGKPTAFSSGTLVERDGTTTALAREDFEIEVLATWKSPGTGAAYPARWRVTLPEHGMQLELAPMVADCELATGGSTDVVYWEGPVDVTGSVRGRGYAELTGYAGSMAGRF